MKVKIFFILLCLIQIVSNFVIVLQSKSNLVSPIISASYQSIFAGIILFLLNLINLKNFKININELIFILLLSFFGMLVAPSLLYISAQVIDASTISICYSFSILFSELISAVIYKRKPKKNIIIGGVMCSIGIIILMQDKVNINLTCKYIFNIFTTLLAVACYMLSGIIVGINHKKNHTNINLLLMYSFLIGGSINLFLCNLLWKTPVVFSFSAEYIALFIFLALIGTVLGTFLSTFLCTAIGQTKTAYSTIIYIIGSVLLSVFLKQWNFDLKTLIGLTLIVISFIMGIILNKPK